MAPVLSIGVGHSSSLQLPMVRGTVKVWAYLSSSTWRLYVGVCPSGWENILLPRSVGGTGTDCRLCLCTKQQFRVSILFGVLGSCGRERSAWGLHCSARGRQCSCGQWRWGLIGREFGHLTYVAGTHPKFGYTLTEQSRLVIIRHYSWTFWECTLCIFVLKVEPELFELQWIIGSVQCLAYLASTTTTFSVRFRGISQDLRLWKKKKDRYLHAIKANALVRLFLMTVLSVICWPKFSLVLSSIGHEKNSLLVLFSHAQSIFVEPHLGRQKDLSASCKIF